MERKTWLIPLFLTVLVVAFSGCNVFPQSVFPQYGNDSSSAVILEDISSKLQEKPVLITFGSESCGACQQQDTVLEYLEKMYDGSVYFVHIDVDDHPRLAGTFGVYAIPDTSVIVAEENGQYVYMDYYGNVSSERSASSRFGPSGVDTLSRVLDMSVDYRNNTSISLENP